MKDAIVRGVVNSSDGTSICSNNISILKRNILLYISGQEETESIYLVNIEANVPFS